MSSAKKITLKSSDGEAFEVDEAVALESQTIKHMIEDDCSDSGILLPKVTSKILAKVIEYCKKHVEVANSEDKPSEDDLKAWDADFVKVDRDTLFDLIQAAHYLKIQSLLDLTCDTVLYMIKGKTPEEVYMFLSRDETRIHAKLVATVGGTSLDLHRLFVEVTSRGGIEKVIVERKWKEVILTFNFKDTIMSASFVVRKSYLSMLYHYEQVYYFGRQGIPPPTPGEKR